MGWEAQLDLAFGLLSRYTSWLHLSANMEAVERDFGAGGGGGADLTDLPHFLR